MSAQQFTNPSPGRKACLYPQILPASREAAKAFSRGRKPTESHSNWIVSPEGATASSPCLLPAVAPSGLELVFPYFLRANARSYVLSSLRDCEDVGKDKGDRPGHSSKARSVCRGNPNGPNLGVLDTHRLKSVANEHSSESVANVAELW